LAVSGLRISEAIKLERQDVDFNQGLLIIRQTKFNKTRLIPLHVSTIRRAPTVCLLAGYVRKARCAIQPRQNQHIRTGLLVDPAAKYLDGTPPRLGNSVLTLIKNILINIVNQSITLSKETDLVFDFLSENIKTTGCADRSASANCIS